MTDTTQNLPSPRDGRAMGVTMSAPKKKELPRRFGFNGSVDCIINDPRYFDSTRTNGIFRIAIGARTFRVIASNKGGWEHVSVSLPDRCPTWDEMCAIKDMFWSTEVDVVQFHPARSRYVNNHPFCLHLWRPVSKLKRLPVPPVTFV